MNDWETFVFKRENLDKIDDIEMNEMNNWCVEKFGRAGRDWDARYNTTTGTIEVHFCNKEMLTEFILRWS